MTTLTGAGIGDLAAGLGGGTLASAAAPTVGGATTNDLLRGLLLALQNDDEQVKPPTPQTTSGVNVRYQSQLDPAMAALIHNPRLFDLLAARQRQGRGVR